MVRECVVSLDVILYFLSDLIGLSSLFHVAFFLGLETSQVKVTLSSS